MVAQKRKGTVSTVSFVFKQFLTGLLLVLFLFIAAASGYKAWQTFEVYREGDESYGNLADIVQSSLPPKSSVSPQSPTVMPDVEIPYRDMDVEIPYRGIDFATLQAINSDAVAWLYCPDTVIDYPIMQATDYDYYLDRLPDGTKNANGSLFLDYSHPSDFSGRLTIIYGHNMKSGQMFGSLGEYKKQAHFERYPYLYLYTENVNYRIELIYGCVVGAGTWQEQAFTSEDNTDKLLAYAADNTTFTSNVEHAPSDQVIVLSTCSYEFDDARYVVVGVLRPE